MRNILVTGGAGFIGASLVRRLVTEGHHVRTLDDQSRGTARRLADLDGAVELIDADVRDTAAVRAALRGVDTCLHLAAVNGTRHFYQAPERVLDVGVRGMLAVLDGCRAEGVGDLILASSSEVYQEPPVVPTPEDVPLVVPDLRNPRYSYGGAKLISELMAINWGRRGFSRVAIVRPHNVYGPDMGFEHVIPALVGRVVAAIAAAGAGDGEVAVAIEGDGTQTRAFVHIDDAVEGFARVLESGAHLAVYHLGAPEEVSIAELTRRIGACLGRRVRVVAGPAASGGTPRRCPDIARLQALGYEPRRPLAEGLPAVVAWYARACQARVSDVGAAKARLAEEVRIPEEESSS